MGFQVAPRAGAWIETITCTFLCCKVFASHPVRVRGLKHDGTSNNSGLSKSHPVRVRGLKPLCHNLGCRKYLVAPRAGAWIETWARYSSVASMIVAPRAGAWIETDNADIGAINDNSRTPCGCVD